MPAGIPWCVVLDSTSIYCTFGRGKINAWIARGAAARFSVNFRNFSPCIARASRLALSAETKLKYQNANIHQKIRVPTSVILPRPEVQYSYYYLVF